MTRGLKTVLATILVGCFFLSSFLSVPAAAAAGGNCDTTETLGSDRDASVMGWHVDEDTIGLMFYDINPQQGEDFRFKLSESAEVLDREGLEKDNGTDQYIWNEESESPFIVYQPPSSRIVDSSDNWMLTRPPEYFGSDVQIYEDRGRAIGGSELMLIGEHREYSSRQGCHEIRIVHPDNVTLSNSPSDVLESLEKADASLDVGYRPSKVTLYAVTDGSEAPGRYYGSGETTVEADSKLEDADNIWLHEYMHSRQSWLDEDAGLHPNMRWFTEASAEYYTARLSLEQDLIGTREYNDKIIRSRVSENVTLSEKRTWGKDDEYQRGARVLAALDYRIQNRTKGNSSLDDVFRRLNEHEGLTTLNDFQGMVSNETGVSEEEWLDDHVNGTEAPRATLLEDNKVSITSVLTVLEPDGHQLFELGFIMGIIYIAYTATDAIVSMLKDLFCRLTRKLGVDRIIRVRIRRVKNQLGLSFFWRDEGQSEAEQ